MSMAVVNVMARCDETKGGGMTLNRCCTYELALPNRSRSAADAPLHNTLELKPVPHRPIWLEFDAT